MQHNSKLTSRAQTLRKNMTKEERCLWYEYLHNYPYRFRRQVTMGNYILDFYCAAAKLVVELDGSQHFTPEGKVHDAARSAYLAGLGIEVRRYTNWAVTTNFKGVCADINRAVRQRVPAEKAEEL